jgi:hypothetical protein
MHYHAYCEALRPLRITMYFKDHVPPHFHIITNNDERVAVVIESLAILAGCADGCDIAEALEWAKNNRETLRALWKEYSE